MGFASEKNGGLRPGVKSAWRRVKTILGSPVTGSRIRIARTPERHLAACGRMGQLVRSRAPANPPANPRRTPGEPPANHGSGRMSAVFWLIDTIIDIYIWLLIAQAILSWLLAFGVVNR